MGGRRAKMYKKEDRRERKKKEEHVTIFSMHTKMNKNIRVLRKMFGIFGCREPFVRYRPKPN